MEYNDIVREVLSDTKLREFIVSSLRESMTMLGFSEPLIEEFLDNIHCLDVSNFIARHREELHKVQIVHFFDKLVPKYFDQYVVPEVPQGKILDFGCGRGTLIQRLIAKGANSEIVGTDISESPEWKSIESTNVRFAVLQESEFLPFLEKEEPDAVTATWVFHHMEFDEQKRYLKALYNALKVGATLIILEDSYSETLPPESGEERCAEFMQLSVEERQKVMGAYDWIANRIFSMRTKMPVTFAYRTVEDWQMLLEDTGFTVTKTRFLGFPENRDVNTAQSVLVAVK